MANGPLSQPSPSESPASTLPLEDMLKKMPRDEVDDLDLVVDDETGDLVQNPDGSVSYVVDEDDDDKDIAFTANLAEHMEETELQAIADELEEKIEADQKARELRDKQYEEGIRRTGMGNDAPGGADFNGASRVVHPMLTEACVDFCASAIKELFPPSGPVKTKIEGKQADPHKYAVAERQKNYLNWQLQTQISEFADEFEQLLTQLPMGGSQYMKFWHDKTLRRVCCEFVPIDDLYLPYACSDFYTAQRVTHVQRLTQHVFEDRVEAKFYRDIGEGGGEDEPGGEVRAPQQEPDKSRAETANDKVEGREGSHENIDGERIVWEVNTFCSLSVDKNEKLPYLISIDKTTKRVLSIYRNWDKADETCTRLDWMIEFGFIAWRGAYKIGLPHLIGSLSAAATGALRALLDSAHINNLPGFMRLKAARMGGQTKQVNPTEGIEIEASAIDDVRKIAMPLPYNQPSAVLMELLGWLTDAGKGVVTTAEEKIADASNQMPVGTVLALMEAGAKVYSSIHARLHRAMTRMFSILGRLNKKYLSLGEQFTKIGEPLATRNDFAEPLAICPVSDPNIYSDAQRFAQAQMVLSLAEGVDPKTGQPTATAQLHDLYEAVKRLYEIAKIPNFEKFLPPPNKPQELNAAAENMAAMMGQPLMAFAPQSHVAHIETHLRFITDPFLGGSPNAAHQTMPMMMEHIKQHLGYLYLDLIGQLIQQATGEKVADLVNDKARANYVDQVIAGASKIVHARMQARFKPLGPVFQQLIQQVADMQPPQPMDPANAMLQAEQLKAKARAQETVQKLSAQQQATQATLAQKDRHHSDDVAIDKQKLALEREGTLIDATQRADELDLQAKQHGDELHHDDVQQMRDIAHEAQQNDLDRVHDHLQDQSQAANAAAQQAAQQAHELDQTAASNEFEANQAAQARAHEQGIAMQDQAHQAQQTDRQQSFQADEAARDRSVQAMESAADRAHQAQTHAADLKDADKARKHSAQVQRESETRKLKAQEKLAKQKGEQKPKPKGKGKAK